MSKLLREAYRSGARTGGLKLTARAGWLGMLTKMVSEGAPGRASWMTTLAMASHDSGRAAMAAIRAMGHRAKDRAHRGWAGGNHRATGPGLKLLSRKSSLKRQRRLTGVDEMV